MRKAVWVAVAMGLAFTGCAGSRGAKKIDPSKLPPEARQAPAAPAFPGAPAAVDPKTAAKDRGATFVDRENGFTIGRPRDTWTFRAGEELNTENIVVPVVVTDSESGAQVVVQVVPAVATPSQFAARLTTGLQSRGGFSTGEVQPIPLAEGAVGFDFQVGDQVNGRVAILEGTGGRVYVLLATWPHGAPDIVPNDVDRIFNSIKTTSDE